MAHLATTEYELNRARGQLNITHDLVLDTPSPDVLVKWQCDRVSPASALHPRTQEIAGHIPTPVFPGLWKSEQLPCGNRRATYTTYDLRVGISLFLQ